MAAIAKQMRLYIQSQSADAAPPLGTVLGNAGVNAVNFCKDFNNATAGLPSFYTVSVQITIFSNRTYTFEVLPPTLNGLLRLLVKPLAPEGGKKKSKKRVKSGSLTLRQVVLLSRWKYPHLPPMAALRTICGTLRSKGILITSC